MSFLYKWFKASASLEGIGQEFLRDSTVRPGGKHTGNNVTFERLLLHAGASL